MAPERLTGFVNIDWNQLTATRGLKRALKKLSGDASVTLVFMNDDIVHITCISCLADIADDVAESFLPQGVEDRQHEGGVILSKPIGLQDSPISQVGLLAAPEHQALEGGVEHR